MIELEAHDRKEPDYEEITHGQIEFPAPNLTNHNWKQRGIMIECDSCPFPHAFGVEPDKQLTGIDANGYPVFKSISD